MKIQKIQLKKNKLIKLKLIKTKIYNSNENIKIDHVISRLKKGLHLIYKYHISNKKILFIGAPININSYFKFKITRHIFLPKSVWVNGILNTQNLSDNFLSKDETSFNLKKKVDLIVILNSSFKENILKESYLENTPTIVLNNSLTINDFKSSYKIPGNFKFTNNKIKDNFFYTILNALFKKSYEISLKKVSNSKNVSKKK